MAGYNHQTKEELSWLPFQKQEKTLFLPIEKIRFPRIEIVWSTDSINSGGLNTEHVRILSGFQYSNHLNTGQVWYWNVPLLNIKVFKWWSESLTKKCKYSNHLNTEHLNTGQLVVQFSNGKVMWLGQPFDYRTFWTYLPLISKKSIIVTQRIICHRFDSWFWVLWTF